MRLTKIYTKVGDAGKTQLVSGEKVLKSDLRIESYGTVDELNAQLGVIRDLIRAVENPSKTLSDLDRSFFRIQNELFDLGSELASPAAAIAKFKLNVIEMDQVTRLEQEIDLFNENLEPLKNFVLPGGHLANSHSHVARTVCRRAERQVVRLRQQEEEVRKETQIYLNRLSDWLFVVSRVFSKELSFSEVLWDQSRRERD